MGKLKASICLYCLKSIKRHDPNRVSIKVGKDAYKEAHLTCQQAQS